MTNTTTTEIALLPPSERAVIALESTKTEGHLRELVKKSAEITAVESKDAREQAHRVGMELKNARTSIQKTGKTAREDATAFSKAVIAEEQRLIAITEGEESRVIGLRDAYDAKLAAEKAAAEAAEKARKDEILGKIQGIRNLPLDLANASAEEVMNERHALAAFVPSPEVFGEFMEELDHALKDTLSALDGLHARLMAVEAANAAIAAERKALEEERARMAAEREEMERMRAEMAAMKAAQEQSTAQPSHVASETVFIDMAQGTDEHGHLPQGDLWGQTMPSDGDVVEAEFVAPAVDLDTEEVTDAEPVSFEVRQFALATAAQFDALADKCDACGAAAFAKDLRAVSYGLREGDHDRVIATADIQALKDADNRLIDATMNAIDAWGETVQVAA